MMLQEKVCIEDIQNLKRAGVVEKRSPLIALAKIYPAPCSRENRLLFEPELPLSQEATTLAKPLTAQYARASITLN